MSRGMELFPMASDTIDERDHNGRSYIVRPCKECGAAVFPSKFNEHIIWHAEIDELVEWAQAVSKLFTKPTLEKEENEGS